jgi:hypothetical protein
MRHPVQFGRREVLEGGLAMGLLLLAGCQQQQLTDLPGPVRPGPAPGLPARKSAKAPVAPAERFPQESVDVLPRSAWARSGVARVNDINPMLPVGRITVHHDGMDSFTSTSQGDAAHRIETIRQAHVNQRKFADIGYHYVIDPGGRVWEGRSARYQGAHVQDNNEGNLGIMCLGNFDLHRPSSAQLSALDRFVATQMRRYRVAINRVYTHQEINPTACPGRNLQSYMVATRGREGNMRYALLQTGERMLALA